MWVRNNVVGLMLLPTAWMIRQSALPLGFAVLFWESCVLVYECNAQQPASWLSASLPMLGIVAIVLAMIGAMNLVIGCMKIIRGEAFFSETEWRDVICAMKLWWQNWTGGRQ